MAPLSIDEAQAAISNWKRGAFPTRNIEKLTVGRDVEARAVHEVLAAVAEDRSGGMFFEADYGRGKSHMLRMVESIALSEGFAVSWIVFDHKSHAFNHPTRYLHGLSENLRVPGYCGRGLGAIVELALAGDQREGLMRFAATAPWFIRGPVSDLSSRELSSDAREMAIRTLESRDLQGKSGIHYYPEVCSRLQAIAQLLRVLTFKGVVWLFDEVECLGRLSNCQSRFAGYSLLRRLLCTNEFPGSYFFFTTTGDFRERLRTEKEPYHRYDGAADFVRDWRDGRYEIHSLRKLGREDRVHLLQAVRGVHSIAYSWDPSGVVTDRFLEQLVDGAMKAGLNERELLKAIVSILEICEQHRDCNRMVELFGGVAESREPLRDAAREEIPSVACQV